MTSALQSETGGTVLFGLGKTLENRKGVAVCGREPRCGFYQYRGGQEDGETAGRARIGWVHGCDTSWTERVRESSADMLRSSLFPEHDLGRSQGEVAPFGRRAGSAVAPAASGR